MIDNIQEGDVIKVDFEEMKRQIDKIENKKEILALLSVTSCFAPRESTSMEGFALLAKQRDIPHVANNAYGLQCSFIAS